MLGRVAEDGDNEHAHEDIAETECMPRRSIGNSNGLCTSHGRPSHTVSLAPLPLVPTPGVGPHAPPHQETAPSSASVKRLGSHAGHLPSRHPCTTAPDRD
jgi:hypothetical protein